MEEEKITEQLEVNKGYTDVCEDVKPTEVVREADIPYYKYMEVVKDNEELKEIIVNLVKKLNRRGF